MSINPQLDAKNAKTFYSKTAVIASSGTDSTEVDLEGSTVAGVITPASMTGTALTFKMATATGGTFVTVKDKDNIAFTITIDTTSTYYTLDPSIFAGIRFIKVVSGSSEAAERTITLAIRPME